VIHWSGEVKGEITLVLDGRAAEPMSPDTAIAEARSLVASGASRSEAARMVAQDSGVSKRVIYQALLDNQT
jgi:16S rRNA (cytidine1402-2'-O)-methyltransferase